jgi:hypothetical protein
MEREELLKKISRERIMNYAAEADERIYQRRINKERLVKDNEYQQEKALEAVHKVALVYSRLCKNEKRR